MHARTHHDLRWSKHDLQKMDTVDDELITTRFRTYDDARENASRFALE